MNETEVVTKLIDLVKDSGTKIWEIMYKQVYVDVINNFIGIILMGLMIHLYHKYVFKKTCYDDEGKLLDDGFGINMIVILIGVPLLFLILIFIILISEFFSNLVNVILNPDYVVLKDIIRLGKSI